jgi:hypothetical protein
MDGQGKEVQVVAQAEPHHAVFSVNDLDMAPVVAARGADSGARPDDGIPRPPYDPLTSGQRVAGVFDVGFALGGGYSAMRKYRNDGLHVFQADIKSLDKLVTSPELPQFRTLGTRLSNEVGDLAASAKDDVLDLQTAKPQLFDNLASRGVWKGLVIKQPKYELMNAGEAAIVDRSSGLGYISESLRRGMNTSSTANFRSGLTIISDLHKHPTAISEGLAPELGKLEGLGARVSDQAAASTITLAAESRALLLKNGGIIGAGIATDMLIEKTLLKDSAPNKLTMAGDFISPFIVLTELPLWAKFAVIVGTHGLTRLAEYGMAKGGSEKSSL